MENQRRKLPDDGYDNQSLTVIKDDRRIITLEVKKETEKSSSSVGGSKRNLFFFIRNPLHRRIPRFLGKHLLLNIWGVSIVGGLLPASAGNVAKSAATKNENVKWERERDGKKCEIETNEIRKTNGEKRGEENAVGIEKREKE